MTTGNNIPPEPQPANPQKVVCLTVTETDDPNHDFHLLREVTGVLLEYPGRDRVNLDIRTRFSWVRMDLPTVSTGYCDGLHTRLEQLLGPDTVVVHQELGLAMEPPVAAPVTLPLEQAPQPDPDPDPEAASEKSPETETESNVPVAAEAEGDEPPF